MKGYFCMYVCKEYSIWLFLGTVFKITLQSPTSSSGHSHTYTYVGICTICMYVMYVWPHVRTIVRVSTCSTLVYMCTTYVVHVCEGRDEAMASGRVILETKK